METLAIVGIVGNIVQFVDFSSKLIAKTTELYRSSQGALAENIDTVTATSHLLLLNSKIDNAAKITGDNALKTLCESCKFTANELLTALDKVRVDGKQGRWKSTRKALENVWSKDQISELGRRLAGFRDELNLHIVTDLREQVLRFRLDHSDRLNGIDEATSRVFDTIVRQQDLFNAVHDKQISLMRTLHGKTTTGIENEHAKTRREIIEEITSNNKIEHTTTRKMVQEIWITLEGYITPLKSLVDLVSRLCVTSHQIYDVLREIRSASLVDTRWTFFQAPYFFEDALGRTYPIPSEFDFEMIRTIIKKQFLGMPGYRQILLNNYELFKSKNCRQIISATTYLRPGTAITMAMLLNTPVNGIERCPIPDCRSTQCEDSQNGGKKCRDCNVWFDSSPTKRRSFGDVACVIETSEYEWLADDLLSVSPNAIEDGGQPYQIDDTSAYRYIKLSTEDIGWDGEDSLESNLHDGLGVFNPAGQVAFTELSRNYYRERLSTEDLGAGLHEFFECMQTDVAIKWDIHKGPDRMQDRIVFVISSCSPFS